MNSKDKLHMIDNHFNIIPQDNGILTIDQIHDWISIASGEFHVSSLSKDIYFQGEYTKKLEKMVIMGFLEKAGKRRGWYRAVDKELKEIDYVNALDEPVDIWLPFEISDLVEIYEGNIIIIAGVPNTGKTSLALNIIKENRHRFDVHYFNSEMGAGELKKRLDLFPDIGIEDWGFKAYSRATKFDDVIKPGANNLNIVDFLEVHDDFFAVGKRIKEIHDKLDGAIGIICLQKNPNQDTGLGGYRSMEVARLVIALDSGRVKITKAKNYRTEHNPNGWIKSFKLVNGCQIIDRNDWYSEKGK